MSLGKVSPSPPLAPPLDPSHTVFLQTPLDSDVHVFPTPHLPPLPRL